MDIKRVESVIKRLESLRKVEIAQANNVQSAKCGYKKGHTPAKDGYTDVTYFNGKWQHYWIKGDFETGPAAENEFYVLEVATGIHTWDAVNPQGLLYLNGKMVQGLDTNHTEVLLEANTKYDFANYFYTGDMNNLFGITHTVCKVYRDIEQLYYDMLVPFEALMFLNENSVEYIRILSALVAGAYAVDFSKEYSPEFFESVRRAEEILQNDFYNKECSKENKPVVHAVGHTHIDVEWLWERNQTREKVQRSFSTAVQLMKYYPEYRFTMSQPELYRYLKEEAPEKYEEVKALVKSKRWEAEGAMYLEADCNLISGESFVRQLLYGKKFFSDEFGVNSHILFLPDVFGYSAAMPQILKKSGIDSFITSKISWNDTNQFPYDNFLWKGIDGSEVFTAFITAREAEKDHKTGINCTYVGKTDPSHTLGCFDRFQQKEYTNHVLMTYGFGDGGGGPTRDMLEKQRRLAKGLPGIPVTKQDSLDGYLESCKTEFFQNAEKLRETPRWVGELYFEYHRGTYTSQAKNKKGNRKAEFLLQKTEALSYMDYLFGGQYDKEGIDDAWKTVLHDQFHDILPGSSIHEVYEHTDEDYRRVNEFCAKTVSSCTENIKKNISSRGGKLLINTLGVERPAVIENMGEVFETNETVPAFGWCVFNGEVIQNSVIQSENRLENDFYILKTDSSGRIISLFDKEFNREVFCEKANEIQIFEDFPNDYDAWEIRESDMHKYIVLEKPENTEYFENGTSKGITVTYRYLDSVIKITTRLWSKTRRIDFDFYADWHEKHRLVKIAFPFDIHTSEAEFDIQFGSVKRPTHKNTSWDRARFEVCAHKWVDVKEDGFGAALINDCKYGFSADENVIKLTALRCPDYPDKTADEGEHRFSYALTTHGNDAGFIKESYIFNQPLSVSEIEAHTGALPERFSLVCVPESSGAVIETVKAAENGGDMIVRLFESRNRRENVKIKTEEKFKKVFLCDLMENNEKELELTDGNVTVPMRNFEIATLRFVK